MSHMQGFPGFPQEGLQFLEQLAMNNNREWFEAHKESYQTYLLEPVQAFITALGIKLQAISDAIHGDTRTDGTGVLMRIYRDTRFSQDKSPYKTTISVLFWEGIGKKTESPAFGFQLEPGGMGLMEGVFKFPKQALEAYRNAVIDEQLGSELERNLAFVRKAGEYKVAGEHYKRVPNGYNPHHRRANLLRHDGLYVSPPTIEPYRLITPELVDICFEHFQRMSPVQQWLVKALGNTEVQREA